MAAGVAALTGGKRLTKAQRMFKKAIQYRKKHGVSLKAAFKAVKGGGDDDAGSPTEPEVMGARRRRGGKTRRRGGSPPGMGVPAGLGAPVVDSKGQVISGGGVASTAASVGGRRSRKAGRRRH